MKKIILSGVTATMLSLSTGAQASPFNYVDYAIGTINYDNNVDSDGDYSSLSLSFETPIVPIVQLEITDQNGYDEIALGAGIYSELGTYSHIYGIVHYVNDDSDDDDIRLTAGLRTTVTDHLEFTGEIRSDITDDDSDIDYKFSLGYYFTENFSVAGNYQILDHANILSASARFNF